MKEIELLQSFLRFLSRLLPFPSQLKTFFVCQWFSCQFSFCIIATFPLLLRLLMSEKFTNMF